MEELIMMLQSIAPLSPDLEKRLRSIIRPLRFKAGELILSPGDVCRQIFYVEKGLIRIYHMLGKNDITDWFIKEKDICISVGSFFDQVESKEYHKALEDCECVGISFDELQQTYIDHPEFNLHGRIISNIYYVQLDNRCSTNKRRKPDEKYEILLKDKPDLLQRVSANDMASYLDVGRWNYFKIKREYLAKSKATLDRDRRLGRSPGKG